MAEQIEFDQAHQALQEVTEALENGRFVHVRRQLQDMEPEDIAHLLEASRVKVVKCSGSSPTLKITARSSMS